MAGIGIDRMALVRRLRWVSASGPIVWISTGSHESRGKMRVEGWFVLVPGWREEVGF